eukprot:g33842.t1
MIVAKFAYAILQLIRFILNHNVFTFVDRFFIQTHGTAMGSTFAPQYTNVFMHSSNVPHLLRRQTRNTIDRVPFIVQYFPGVQKLHHVLRSLQHIIDDDEHLAKIFPT